MLVASITVLNLVDTMASTLGQPMQLARTRVASATSPIMRLMIQRDHEVTEPEFGKPCSNQFRSVAEMGPISKLRSHEEIIVMIDDFRSSRSP